MNPANFSSISFPILGIEVNPGRTFAVGPLTVHFYGLVIALGLILAAVIWFARNAEPLHGPLSGIVFAYAILSPAIVAGMHFLKRQEKKKEEQIG